MEARQAVTTLGACRLSTRISVVIPAHDAAASLPAVLRALVPQAGEAEVVVVDAGSADATAAAAAAGGVSVLRLDGRRGPAEARNAGALASAGDVVLFLDADCVPHPDLIERVRSSFDGDRGLVSLCGSYDDDPLPGFFTRYMNLRHHYFHQTARTDCATFWAGCGAVRREDFLAVGGFDERRYPLPMIEDLELGLRLRACGSTRLDPDLRVRHLKRWTLRGVLEADIVRRALPWTALIFETGHLSDDLNLRWSQRLAALLAPLVLASPLIVTWALVSANPVVLAVLVPLLALSLWSQAGLVRLFARVGGWRLALPAFAFHQVHHLCCLGAFGWGAGRHLLRRAVRGTRRWVAP